MTYFAPRKYVVTATLRPRKAEAEYSMPTLRAERAEPVAMPPQETANTNAPEVTSEPREAMSLRGGSGAMVFAITLSAFWIGAAGAFLWGYFGPQALSALGPHLLAFVCVATFLPPFLFVAAAMSLARAHAMGRAAQYLAATAQNLISVDDTAVRGVQRVGRAVRRELDALNVGLDGAFQRLRALETALEDRVAQLDEAAARAGVKADVIARHLHEERERIEDLAGVLDDALTRASEMFAGRAAQLKAMIEASGGELKSVGQTLEAQCAQFREAAEKAAQAPQAAALELDRQAKRIETAADGAVARAEFVLARQERQRTAMNDLLSRLKGDSQVFEDALETQRNAIERAAQLLASEAQRLDELADQGLRRIDAAMASAGPRTMQMASGFLREADRVKETAEAAATSVSRLVDTLREASASAQALIVESTSDAKRRAKDFVGEAMGECDRLLRAAASVAEEAEKARVALANAAAEAEQHIVSIPGVAVQEAQRMREAMRNETNQMLDISARTLATLHTRSPLRRPALGSGGGDGGNGNAAQAEGLLGLAKRITGAPRKGEGGKASFELSAVLAAADTGDPRGNALRSNAAMALSALEAALVDLAIDLDPVVGDSSDPVLWRRYLEGDRGAFARKLAQAIGPETVDRIASLYRDNIGFREAANTYLKEFENVLARSKDADYDGLLSSTLLTADTGKVYLMVAYALGRLD